MLVLTDAAAMPDPKLKGGLEALDRSDATLPVLVAHAAQVLDVDLCRKTAKSTERRLEPSTSTYSFKEQWVLRWLTRSIATALQAPKDDKDNASFIDILMDPAPWRLMRHLLAIIPSDIAIDILVERKFISSLDLCVRHYLERQLQPAQSASYYEDAGTREGSRKRRRLSKSPSTQLSREETLSVDLLQLCAVCALLISPSHNAEDQVQVNLSISNDESASMLASSLSLATRLLSSSLSADLVDTEAIIALLRFWSGRPAAASESARHNDLKLFNKQCLPVCLDLLHVMERKDTGAASNHEALRHSTEHFIASAVVIPLRARFMKRHAAVWKKQRLFLTWDVLGTLYQDTVTVLGANPDPAVGATDMADFTWKAHAHRLYDLASRLLPKYDLRRKQQEQDWLDYFLITLAYICSPRLPQLVLSTQDKVQVADVAYSSQLSNSFDGFERLVELVAQSRCSPSRKTTSYVAAVVAVWHDLPVAWTILGYLLQTEDDLLLPHAGMPTSDLALTEIIARIEQSTLSLGQIVTVKNGVVLPVLRAFSRARALKDFVSTWQQQLQEALRVTSSTSHDDNALPAIMVWQDEDLFDSFSQEVSLSTSNTASEDILTHLRTTLAELPSRLGTTLDIFAQISIAIALLQAKRRSPMPLETQVLQAVVELTVVALEKKSDYQGQRWRLWTLLTVIQSLNAQIELSEKALNTHKASPLGPSLAVLNHQENSMHTAQWYQECLEKFKLITVATVNGRDVFATALNEAIGQLDAYIQSLGDRKAHQAASGLWNGRSLHIQNNDQLASACVGVLLSKPASLKDRPAFFDSLLQALLKSSAFDHNKKASPTVGTALEHVMSAALCVTDPKAAREARKALSNGLTAETSIRTTPQLQHLVERFLLQDRGSSILRSFANVVYEQLQTAASGNMQPGEVARRLAIMDSISDQHSSTFTRPEAWSIWLMIGNSLPNDGLWADYSSAFAICRSFRNISRRIWTNAIGNEVAQVSLAEILSGFAKLKPSTSKARLPKQLGLLLMIEAMFCNTSTLDPLLLSSLRELTSTFGNIAANDLRVLVSSIASPAALCKIAIILETASRAPKTELGNGPIISSIEAILQALSEAQSPKEIELIMLQQTVRQQCLAITTSLSMTSTGLEIERLQTLRSTHLKVHDTSQWQLASAAGEADVFIRGLTTTDRAACMSLMNDAAVSVELGDLKPFLVAAIALQSGKDEVEANPQLKAGLADVARLQDSADARDFHVLLLELENANLVLNTHPTVVGQAVVEDLLAQLALILSGSRASSWQNMLQPQLLHTRVCTLVGSLLSRYRRRIADRYHLLLPVLQQLTRCLFYSEEVVKRARQSAVIGSDPSSFLRSIPNWLISRPDPLPPASGVEVSRLLSSICNPTVSAAKSSRSRGRSNELNDETKRVKAVAGQHLQYLVMDYCRCSLDGDIAPAVKEKLLPGMYTVLDAMNRDLMRAMNSAMDPSSRAIFKTLYDDWTRYGKWDKS